VSEAGALQAFVMDILKDAGAEVSEHGGVLWVRVPEALRQELEVPADVALVFDPERAGEFGAELVAPGSFVLERLLALAMRRGRWDVGRLSGLPEGWAFSALKETGVPRDWLSLAVVSAEAEDWIGVFTFRVTLVSDEKRESFYAIAVSQASEEGWEVPFERAAAVLESAPFPREVDLEPMYRTACDTLRRRTEAAVDSFRRMSLSALEEEVRRIFAFFDGTAREVSAAGPEGADDLLRALEAERDRRLAEALERFEPHAMASLCGIRLVGAPAATVRVDPPGRAPMEVRVDAFTRIPRGFRCGRCGKPEGPWAFPPGGSVVCLPCAATGGASVPLPARPPSGIPRRRRKDVPGGRRSPRGSTAQSRSSAGSCRGP